MTLHNISPPGIVKVVANITQKEHQAHRGELSGVAWKAMRTQEDFQRGDSYSAKKSPADDAKCKEGRSMRDAGMSRCWVLLHALVMYCPW